MALSERLAYVLDFNVQGAVKSLEKVGATADKELSKADQKLDKLAGNLTKFGVGALAVAGVAGAALVGMGNKASDLAESINAVEVTFGEAAAGIKQLGSEAAESVGLSEAAFNGLAVQFAGFAKQIAGPGGDVVNTVDTMTTRIADFASVMNQEVPDAAAIFQSALSGETEPIRKFGIDMSAAAVAAHAVEVGISESAAAMTDSEKVQARYSLLMQETSQWSGDFANTADGAANKTRVMKAQMEDLQAKIGAGVLPMMTKLLGIGQKLIVGFDKLNDAMGGNLGTFAAYGVAGLAVVGVLSSVAGMVIKARDNFKNLGTSMSNAGGKAKGFATALGVAGIALAAWQLNASANAGDINDMAVALANTARETDETAAATVKAIAAMGGLTGDLKPAIDQFVKGNIEAAKRLIETGAAAEGGAEFLDLLTKAIADEEKARKQATATVETYTDSTEAATEAVEDGTVKAGHASDAQREYERQLLASNEAAKASKKALEESNWYIRKQAEDADNASREIDGLKVSHQELRDELSDRSAYLDLEDSFDNVQTAAVEAYTAAAEGSEDAETKARDFERAQIDLKNKVLDYIESLGGVPDEIATEVLAMIDEGDLAAVEEKLAWLSRQRYADVLVRLSGGSVTGDGGINFGGNVVARAHGGTVHEPVTLVGEDGPELAEFPSGTRIHTAAQTRSMLNGGSGTTVIQNFHLLSVTDEATRFVKRVVEQALREAR